MGRRSGAIVASALRLVAPGQPAACDPSRDAAACREALLDGTADAIATDHAPHASVDKDVEFGLAANGISGLETALGVVLAMVDAGLVPLARAIAALTAGPALVLGSGWGDRPTPGLVEGGPADLVVFDRSATWRVEPDALRRAAGTRRSSAAISRGSSCSRSRAGESPTRPPRTDDRLILPDSGYRPATRRLRCGAMSMPTSPAASGLNRDYERRPYWHATMPTLAVAPGSAAARRRRRRRDRRRLHRDQRGPRRSPAAARRSPSSRRSSSGSAAPPGTAGSSIPATSGARRS